MLFYGHNYSDATYSNTGDLYLDAPFARGTADSTRVRCVCPQCRGWTTIEVSPPAAANTYGVTWILLDESEEPCEPAPPPGVVFVEVCPAPLTWPRLARRTFRPRRRCGGLGVRNFRRAA